MMTTQKKIVKIELVEKPDMGGKTEIYVLIVFICENLAIMEAATTIGCVEHVMMAKSISSLEATKFVWTNDQRACLCLETNAATMRPKTPLHARF
jgi:hypothetical protein